ncbi:hypothetical protein VTO73DRAFT_12476 [Trametes versicolor]
MSERPPSPFHDFAPPTPAMPLATIRGKRKTNAQEENAGSKAPVALPPASNSKSNSTVTTVARNGGSKVYLKAERAHRSASDKSSAAFPTSSGLALPVLTTTHARFADIAYRLLNAPKTLAQGEGEYVLGKRARPSATRTKSKDQQKKAVFPTSPPLWRALETQGKVVIAETLDYELLGTLPYGGSMVTPAMLREGLLTPDTAYHAWVGAKRAIEERRPSGEWDLKRILDEAMLFYLVELGASMADRVNGPHYTFVDPRYHDDAASMVKQALRLARLFAKQGYGRERLVVTIPATEAGVQAAKTLGVKHHVQTNLTLVSGLAHAAACAEAGATCITLCYRQVSDACGRRTNSSNPFIRAWEAFSAPSRRLAEETIQETAAYFNMHKLQSAIVVANLESTSDAERLGEVDAVAFTAGQSLAARAPAPGLPQAAISLAGTQAKQRACEAQYPTSYLASKDGAFLSAMPVDARTTAKVTLATGLQDLMEHMHRASMHMLEFIQGEAQLAHVDDIVLQSFYDLDEMEADRLGGQNAAGKSAEEEYPVRWYDVGFRLRYSTWDEPALYRPDCEGLEDKSGVQ